MVKSLQEQLLKAGLVNANQVKQAKSAKRKQSKQQRKNKTEGIDASKLRAQKAAIEKATRDRELNLRRQKLAGQKAIGAAIRQLIDTHQLPINANNDEDEDDAFNFTDQGKVKRIFISRTQRKQIASGKLAIVKSGQQYALVPAGIGKKIQQRSTEALILLNDPQENGAVEDESYAQYQIPDDLMW